MKKNDYFEGICSGYTKEGYGVVKVDHFPFFVKGILENEQAKLSVMSIKKNYGFARIIEIIEKSNERVEPLCISSSTCGGCKLQHFSYLEQCRFKEQLVKDCMQRIGKIDCAVNSILGAKQIWNYRNKGQIPVGFKMDKVITGFYRIHSNDIVDIDTCLIQSQQINQCLATMRELFALKPNAAAAFRHILIKHAIETDELMVVFICNTQSFDSQSLFVKTLCLNSNIKTIVLNVNNRDDNVILGDNNIILYGDGYIEDMFAGYRLRISTHSFYQIHHKQCEALYEKALELANVNKNDRLLDLYCGVGSIAIFFAKYVKEVVGIEIIPEAIIDAKKNAELNNINNIKFECSSAQAFATRCVANNEKMDIVILDPPRKGSDKDTIECIVKMEPSRIIYISCDPATCARDLVIFMDLGYNVDVITPVDMFPQCTHVECVVKISQVVK